MFSTFSVLSRDVVLNMSVTSSVCASIISSFCVVTQSGESIIGSCPIIPPSSSSTLACFSGSGQLLWWGHVGDVGLMGVFRGFRLERGLGTGREASLGRGRAGRSATEGLGSGAADSPFIWVSEKLSIVSLLARGLLQTTETGKKKEGFDLC